MAKKIISFIITFFLFLLPIFADELNLNSDKYILYNLNDDSVLFEHNSNEKTQIASLTKIMTTIVAIENVKDYNKKVTITKEMFNDIEWDVATAGYKVGDKVTYNDLLYGAILPSGADAVNALAYSVFNNYDTFIKKMNEEAKKLSLKNTKFTNPIGLYNENNYSSAKDIATLLIYALKNSKFREVFKAKNYTSTNGVKMKSTIESYNTKNSNENLTFITGAKTGYIKKAGYCLATTAEIDGIEYLLVTLNAYTSGAPHIKDAVKTYKYYSENYGYKNIVKKNSVVAKLPTKYSKEKEIEVKTNKTVKHYLKNDFKIDDVEYKFEGVKYITPFTKQGSKIGVVEVKYKNETLDKFDLIYSQKVKFSLFSFIWEYKIIILIFIVIIYMKTKSNKLKKLKKRRKIQH